MTTQLECVNEILSDGETRTAFQIQAEAAQRFDKYMSDAAITARIRDLRKPQYGAHKIKCTCKRKGRFIYQMVD